MADRSPVVRVPLIPRGLRVAAVLVVAGTIAYFSLVTEASPPSAGPFFDKYVHFAGYTVLALLAAYATATLRDRPITRAVAVVVGVAAYGFVVELLQAPLPGRQFSLYDQVANTLGALTVVVWLLIERRVRYRRVAP
ncbi:VanZ family protein [Halobaculum sp. MBLA0143]|uniref:VanZ family protein n=1 Tax=Halobaculum sp. MBLA0143 TaxID=3079933 RepID=UPI0035239DAD